MALKVMTPSWPVCKVKLNKEEMFYIGFSKEDALGIGKDQINKDFSSKDIYHSLVTQYNGHIPINKLDRLGGQKIESGPGYLMDAESLKKYLKESHEDVTEIILKIGDKLNPEKSEELRENLTSYENVYEEIFGVELKQNN